jgi:hypothetical protein
MSKEIDHHGHCHLMDLRNMRKIFCHHSTNRLKSFVLKRSLPREMAILMNMCVAADTSFQQFLDHIGESFNMSKMLSQIPKNSSLMFAMTQKVPSKPRSDKALEPTHPVVCLYFRNRVQVLYSVLEMLLVSDSPQPLACRALIQRRLLASHK